MVLHVFMRETNWILVHHSRKEAGLSSISVLASQDWVRWQFFVDLFFPLVEDVLLICSGLLPKAVIVPCENSMLILTTKKFVSNNA